MPNLSGGSSISNAPTSTEPTIAYNTKVARRAERLGFDFLLPAARWKGFGGELDNQGASLDCFAWAAAIATATERIGVWSTVHTTIVPPLICAKIGATLQEISGGRWGLNIVTGWNGPEAEMFGLEPKSREERNEATEEWVRILRLAWTEQDFDFDGRHHRVFGGVMNPKPDPLPTLMNAGESTSSRELAATYMDFHFAVADRVDVLAERVSDMRDRAARRDRTVDVFTPLFVVARDTEAEARAAVDEIVAQTDRVCIDNVLRVMNLPAAGARGRMQEYGYERWNRGTLEERLIVGWLQPLIVGTPETVAEQLVEYASSGIRGVMLDWYDFDAELAYFGERVLPLLERAGLRHAPAAVAS